ncbi:MAG: thioredoxin-disulfide reductase [Firmicutes bacterium]|nr:thioredoxin-disulfide reductase [Bacillota bacterium]
MPNEKRYDILIVGAGPAGYTAGLYAARAGRSVLMIDKGIGGGQLASTFRIENYPGVSGEIPGFDLAERMKTQALQFGAVFSQEEVVGLVPDNDLFVVQTTTDTYTARAVILATGASPRKLEVDGEARLTGRGVSYCATCDGAFFRGKNVAVVGGGNSAVEEALFLAQFANEVTIVHRRSELRADKVIQEEAINNPNIKLLYNYVVASIAGEDKVTGLNLASTAGGPDKFLPCDGVFVYVGNIPNSQLVRGLVELDEQGFVLVDDELQTSLPGLYAAGDVRHKFLRQVVTACSDGATAATAAAMYLSKKGA